MFSPYISEIGFGNRKVGIGFRPIRSVPPLAEVLFFKHFLQSEQTVRSLALLNDQTDRSTLQFCKAKSLFALQMKNFYFTRM